MERDSRGSGHDAMPGLLCMVASGSPVPKPCCPFEAQYRRRGDFGLEGLMMLQCCLPPRAQAELPQASGRSSAHESKQMWSSSKSVFGCQTRSKRLRCLTRDAGQSWKEIIHLLCQLTGWEKLERGTTPSHYGVLIVSFSTAVAVSDLQAMNVSLAVPQPCSGFSELMEGCQSWHWGWGTHGETAWGDRHAVEIMPLQMHPPCTPSFPLLCNPLVRCHKFGLERK